MTNIARITIVAALVAIVTMAACQGGGPLDKSYSPGMDWYAYGEAHCPLRKVTCTYSTIAKGPCECEETMH